MERKTRFELATPSLARRCSTTEPLPLAPFGTIFYHKFRRAVKTLPAVLYSSTTSSNATRCGRCIHVEVVDKPRAHAVARRGDVARLLFCAALCVRRRHYQPWADQ